MLKVYKYEIPADDEFALDLPKGAKVLHVNCQPVVQAGTHVFLWALVNPVSPHETRRFRLAGTGHAISQSPDRLKYVGTFMIENGALVFHLFEIVSG